MASKRKAPPPSGQKSIASFFVARPKPAQQDARKPSPRKSGGTPAKKRKMAETEQTGAPGPSPKARGPLAARKLTPPPAKTDTALGPEQTSTPAAASIAPQGKPAASPKPKAKSPAAAAAKPAPSGEVIGKRVSVFWPNDDAWYEGSVEKSDGAGKHLMLYDDGDEEWVDLAKEKIKWVERKGQAAKDAVKARNRARVLMSDSDDEMPDAHPSGDDSGSEFEVGAAGEADEADDESGDEEEDEEELSEGASDEEQPKKRVKGKPAKTPAARKKSGKAQPGPTPATAKATPASGQPTRPPSSHLKKTPVQRIVSEAEKGALRNALESATPTPIAATVAGGAVGGLKSALSADVERYAARAADRFPFLRAGKIKDASGKTPDHPDYNPRTLYILPNWFKDAKVSEGQRQWWLFKARNFDSVMLFKMGKFYEMFEMDAHVGAEVLGLSYMKGEQPHCGFPEANYHQHAERLAREGLRVVVIEQTETPDQLRIRNEKRKAGQPKTNVVNRDMVAVLTKGTLTDSEMLHSSPDASYTLALTEEAILAGGEDGATEASMEGPRVRIGACAVDVATGQMLIGQWEDDDMRTRLRAHLTAIMPVELVLPAGVLSRTTQKALTGALRSPRINELLPGTMFWDAARTASELAKGAYFGSDAADRTRWPSALQALIEAGPGGSLAVSAVGGCVSFLREVLLDRAVVPLGRMELLPDQNAHSEAAARASSGAAYMALDGAALENLEVLESTNGGRAGTLLAALDHCVTAAGRRLLRTWLCRPLLRIPDIVARQDAVHDLMTVANDVASTARKAFQGVGDLERSLARLHASGSGSGTGRDAANVVLYEDAAKRRVNALAAALKGLQTVQAAVASFDSTAGDIRSTVLHDLVTPGKAFPDLQGPLEELESATDWEEAAANGRVVPRKGVDEAFDAAEAALADVDADLKTYLAEIRQLLKGGREIQYVSVNKESHLLEVPEALVGSGTADFELVAQRKGFQRFMSRRLRTLVTRRAAAMEQREAVLSGILQGLLKRFAAQHALWMGAVEAMAQLDALMSLAFAAMFGFEGDCCRPVFLAGAAPGEQVFRARDLRHPAGVGLQKGAFVPNDVQLGGEQAPFIVLTGPNMGGKSTMLRQVCLAALMAQVGAWVPAASLELTPVDAIFVRMGARDAIMSGQSTFFVELSETAAALNRATCRSLVALDELGRGTSTSDGAAIAAAVLEHLAAKTRCLGLFATHYHRLADAYAADPNIGICHMLCAVEEPKDGKPEQVTFLYKLAGGACPKSYGTNVARLAGLPDAIVARAAAFAEQLEHEHQRAQAVPAAGAACGVASPAAAGGKPVVSQAGSGAVDASEAGAVPLGGLVQAGGGGCMSGLSHAQRALLRELSSKLARGVGEDGLAPAAGGAGGGLGWLAELQSRAKCA